MFGLRDKGHHIVFKVHLRTLFSVGLLATLLACSQKLHETTQSERSVHLDSLDLTSIRWAHGTEDCETERRKSDYAEWQQVRFQEDTYILRQNKCSNYEAPFVYFFVGKRKALLIDTGATEDGGEKLLSTLRAITDLPIIAAHSHGHSDHRKGDNALKRDDNIVVVETDPLAVQEFFGFSDWPRQSVSLDLGNRTLELLPIPGHADDDIAFWDPASQLLVTGDTLYPGRLYINEWSDYRASIARLNRWIEDFPVTYVMGTHIEMSNKPNIDYPIGSTYQPEERHLPLQKSDIEKLHQATKQMEIPKRTFLGDFILWPPDNE